jgi:hypothetical protein
MPRLDFSSQEINGANLLTETITVTCQTDASLLGIVQGVMITTLGRADIFELTLQTFLRRYGGPRPYCVGSALRPPRRRYQDVHRAAGLYAKRFLQRLHSCGTTLSAIDHYPSCAALHG